MALAQGLENAARQDLSWIEKALFRLAHGGGGHPGEGYPRRPPGGRSGARAFPLGLCRTLGPDLIALIGRAPKAGRPRWTELAAAASAAPSGSWRSARRCRWKVALDGSSSDQRFARALAGFAEPSRPSSKRVLAVVAPGGPPLGGPPLARRKSRSRSRKARTGSSLFSKPNCRPSRRATARAERSSEAARGQVPGASGH